MGALWPERAMPNLRRILGRGGVCLSAAALAIGAAAARAAAPPRPSLCLSPAALLAISVGMLVITFAVHTFVTVIHAEVTHRVAFNDWVAPRSRRRLLVITAMALLTAAALFVEILLWALLYQGFGLFPSLAASLYFSGITFTTVGYGDVTLPECWRLLSVVEAVDGVLLAGWSTALLVYVVQRMMELRLRREGRTPPP
jgi:voltage-gated potassium channel Kch